MSLLKGLRELCDRVIMGFVIVAVVVWFTAPDGYRSLDILWRLTALAVIPLTAAVIAWGAEPPGLLLFLYGAVAGAISLFVMLMLSGIAHLLDFERVGFEQTKWIIFAGTFGIGLASIAAGRFVSSRTGPRNSEHWRRLKAAVRAKISWPNFGMLFCLTPLFLCVVLFAASFWLDAGKGHIALGPGAFVGVSRGTLSVFSDGQNGPYCGGIVALTDGIHPPDFDETGFDFPGIYYRWFGFKTGPMWTLTISLLLPLGWALIPVELLLLCRLRGSGDPCPRPFQFSLKSLLVAMFWFCVAASLFSVFATGGFRHPVAAYGAIVSACLAIGTIRARTIAAALVGATIVVPLLICSQFGRL